MIQGRTWINLSTTDNALIEANDTLALCCRPKDPPYGGGTIADALNQLAQPQGDAGDYFVHFAVLRCMPLLRPTGLPFIDFAIMYAIVVISTVTISSVTYLFIEMPMIRLGNTLIGSRRPLPIRPAEA